MQSDISPRPDPAAVNLLWTGGWDSTFQLLRLLLEQGRHVTPYYLVDATRPSTAVERATMQRIVDHIAAAFPEAAARLRPTRTFEVARLQPDEAMARAYRTVRRETSIGQQYEWLSRFCQQNGIDEMQLCIHRDDKAHRAIEPFATGIRQVDGFTTYRVDPQFNDRPEYLVFGRFSFPLLEFTKLEMAAHAEQRGWTPLMAMTWFCHRPRRDLQPCGQCNPCRYTIEEGLGWRVPESSRSQPGVYAGVIRPLGSAVKKLVRRLDMR